MSHFENSPSLTETLSPREKVILAVGALKQIIEVVREQGIDVEIDNDSSTSLGPILTGTVDEAEIFQPEYTRGWHSEAVDPDAENFNINIIFSADGAQSDFGFSANASLELFFATKDNDHGGLLSVKFKSEKNKWYALSTSDGDKPKEVQNLISQLKFEESEIEIDEAQALDIIKKLTSFMKIKLTTETELT